MTNFQTQIKEKTEQKQYETKVLFREALARCLALENITVQHTNTTTAAFYLEDRILMLPNWTGVSDSLYCAFIVHEVGHALYTPQNLPKQFGFTPSECLHLIANIVEDVRIEKLMLKKFPGFRTDFVKANFELKELDFYGDLNFSEMNVFDRFNIHFKLGRYLGISVPFSDEERPYVDLIDSCETYQDVVRVSIELKNKFFKNKPQSQSPQSGEGESQQSSGEEGSEQNSSSRNSCSDPTDENQNGESSSDENGSEDGDDSSSESGEQGEGGEETSAAGNSNEEGDAEGDSSGAGEDGEEEGDSSESSLENGTDMKGGQNKDAGKPSDFSPSDLLDEDNFNVETQSNYDKNLEGLSRGTSRVPTPVSFDGKMNLDDVIIGYKKILKGFDFFYTKQENAYSLDYGTAYRNEFLKRNKKTLDFLVSEFNKKKSATEFHRRRQSKSGTLALNKLHKYQYSEDIFQNVMIQEDGKSHGLVMYLDQSGSMRRNMTGAIEQILILVMFCRRINLPFRVFGFSDNDYYSDHESADDSGYCSKYRKRTFRSSGLKRKQANELVLERFNLREYFSSDMSTIEFNKIFLYLSTLAYAWDREATKTDFGLKGKYNGKPRPKVPWFESLGGTPLNPAILTGIQLIPEFKRKYKLDIVNSVFITDGENGHGMSAVRRKPHNRKLTTEPLGGDLLLTEKISGKTFLVEHGGYYGPMTRDLLSMTRQITGSKIIGFFIENPSRIIRKALDQGIHNAKELLERDNFIEIQEAGYDAFYQIPNGEDLQVKDTSGSGDVLERFKKAQIDTRKQRILLSKFIDLIS
jgi:hypothetical protein